MQLTLQGGGVTKLAASASDLTYSHGVLYSPAGATITIVDKYDVTTAGLVLTAGYHPIQVKKVTVITSGDVYLIHNQDNS